MTNIDENFGEQVRARRQELGLSQAQLAETMTEQGHKWHKQTSYAVEKGQRRVTFNEALALSRVLGLSMDTISLGAIEGGDQATLHLQAMAMAGALGRLDVQLSEMLDEVRRFRHLYGEDFAEQYKSADSGDDDDA